MMASAIARSGMAAAMVRLTASASNVANSESDGAIPAAVAAGSGGPATVYQARAVTQSETAGGGVQASVGVKRPPYRLEHDPSAPYADARGMVAAPEIDLNDERIKQIAAKQAYMANLALLRSADEMERSLLVIT